LQENRLSLKQVLRLVFIPLSLIENDQCFNIVDMVTKTLLAFI